MTLRRFLLLATLTVVLICDAAAPNAAQVAGADTAVGEVRALLADAKYADAEARARAVLSERESLSADSLDVARTLDVLVQVLVEAGKAGNPEALERARRAVGLKESLLGANNPEVAASLSQLGLVLRRTGQLKEAGEAYARALRIQEQALGPAHPEVARTLAAQTALANGTGEFARARELGERAIGIAERAQPADGVLTAVAANNLAIALYELNDYAGSQRRFEQSLRSYEAALGPDHPEVAKTSTNLANVVGEAGELTAARALYERAIAIQERRQGPDHPDVALGLNNLADIYVRIGDYAQAQRLFERALAILERAFGAQHTRVAMALGNLAEVRVRQGQYTVAEPLYERALEIREASLGPDHPSLVYTLTGLGDLRKELGQTQQARALYERALTTAERAFGPDHPMVALALHGLGDILLDMKELAAAEQRVTRAIDMRRQLLGDDHPLVAESRALLALILARTGRPVAAVESALEAERVARDHMQVTAQALSERHAATYAEHRVSGAAIALSLLETEPAGLSGLVAPTWDAVVRSRAAILEEVASRHRLVAGTDDSESVRLATTLIAARERLAGLLARGAADPASRTRVEEAARERDDAERMLAEHSLRFRTAQQRGRVGFAEAVAALPADAALVAFVKFRRMDVRSPGPASARVAPGRTERPRDGDAYLALIARPGAPPSAVPLGDSDRIEAAVTRWRSGIAAEIEAGRPSARTERVHRTDGTALRQLVWDPVRQAIDGARQVFLVADGSLHLVNFGALPRSAGGYLVEDQRLLHHLSAERDLAQADTPLGRGLLVVDDPDYDTVRRAAAPRIPASPTQPVRSRRPAAAQAAGSAPPCSDLQSLRFDTLPETRREADAIAALWSAAEPARTSDADAAAARGAVRRLTGSSATEAALKNSAAGKRVVHLATHGFFLGAWCAPGAGTAEAAVAGPAPLLLAGLALSGANERIGRPVDEDDGILMAEEVATLDLHGVEWAVLSACDTGVGLPRAGEGLFGLRRMFQIAGARTVIVTLWPVVDEITREWMSAAYRGHFVRQRPTADALREATIQLLARRRARQETTHPAYWAAFVGIGKP